MCGHGRERWAERAPVDGYNKETKTVFQYNGCHWHGCPRCYPNGSDKIIASNDQTREDRYKATLKRTRAPRRVGYNVIEAWACEVALLQIDKKVQHKATLMLCCTISKRSKTRLSARKSRLHSRSRTRTYRSR